MRCRLGKRDGQGKCAVACLRLRGNPVNEGARRKKKKKKKNKEKTKVGSSLTASDARAKQIRSCSLVTEEKVSEMILNNQDALARRSKCFLPVPFLFLLLLLLPPPLPRSSSSHPHERGERKKVSCLWRRNLQHAANLFLFITTSPTTPFFPLNFWDAGGRKKKEQNHPSFLPPFLSSENLWNFSFVVLERRGKSHSEFFFYWSVCVCEREREFSTSSRQHRGLVAVLYCCYCWLLTNVQNARCQAEDIATFWSALPDSYLS